jgi:hypothetical protein
VDRDIGGKLDVQLRNRVMYIALMQGMYSAIGRHGPVLKNYFLKRRVILGKVFFLCDIKVAKYLT